MEFNKADISFLEWLTMDAAGFAEVMLSNGGENLKALEREKLVLAWNAAGQYVATDPDANGSKLPEGERTQWCNYHTFLVATGILLGAMANEQGTI
ncbi:MAG: hypothetical protein Q8R28_15300 [Dehalococcoidia bacterium]|nr:hypothetical protein [Dehalococcoidia bacterium]